MDTRLVLMYSYNEIRMICPPRYDKIPLKERGMIYLTGGQKLQSPSVPDLQNLRAKFSDELWTGVLEAEYPTQEKVVFLFSRGMLICVYRLGNNFQKLDKEQEWNALLDLSIPSLAFTALNISGLRLVRIILEHPLPSETRRVSPGLLDTILDQWHRYAYPNLASITWVNGQGFAVLWPDVAAPSASAVITTSGTYEASEAVRVFLSHEMGECDAARHEFVSDGSAWEEYGFQFICVRLLGAILARYKELTGLALLNALDRNINRIAFENKWDFSITLGDITDRMFFCDLDDTIGACKTLLQVACDHISVVLGQKLSRSMVHEAIASLDAHSIRVVEKYSIDAFLGSPRTIISSEERASA